ncbi:non-canonical purine NTP pyrophosphatase [Candidatus Saccharibacteria bacterium]|nr:non-canonical purine NTP pyrophosphatase [Candidatus Saccharibacteria bacterium]
MELFFATGNPSKVAAAQHILSEYDIKVIQKDIEVPEIQAKDSEEIARFSARYAADQLKKPVFVSDGGYYIRALKGFPGPFIRYINEWLSGDDLLRLMIGVEDRYVLIRETIAFCEPGKHPIAFTGELKAEVALELAGAGELVDTALIHDGCKAPFAAMAEPDRSEYWKTHMLDHYHAFGQYLKEHSRS